MSSGLSSSARSSPIPDLAFDPYRSLSLRDQTLVNRQLRSGPLPGGGGTSSGGINNLDTTTPHSRPRLPNPNIHQNLGFTEKDYVKVHGDTYALGPYTSETLALWILLAFLILLVIANSTLTFLVFGSLRLGSGMESIEFLPDLLKFYGDTDLDEINKLDGRIQSFGNEPMELNAAEGGKIHLLVHEGSGPSLSLDKTGINISHVEEFRLIGNTGESIFSTRSPILDLPKGVQDFRAKIARVNRITSAINSSLEFSSSSFTHLKGSEGTRIEGNKILISADRDISFKAINGNMILSGRNGVNMYTDFLPVVEAFGVKRNQHTYPTQGRKQVQFKICICMPAGKLFRIEIPLGNNKSTNDKEISCSSAKYSCE